MVLISEMMMSATTPPERRCVKTLRKNNAVLLIITLLAISQLSLSVICCAQSPLFKLPARTSIHHVTWKDSIYRFPEFQDGKIIFMTGFSPQETFKFNYNLYFGQVDFIDKNGDTLQVKPSKELKQIDIGDHSFYHDDHQGYIEILYQAPVSLGTWTFLNSEDPKHERVYYSYYQAVDTRGDQSIRDRYYRLIHVHFLIDRNNKLHKVLKPTVLKLFPGHKKEIIKYLDDHNVDFLREQDLIALIQYCNALP